MTRLIVFLPLSFCFEKGSIDKLRRFPSGERTRPWLGLCPPAQRNDAENIMSHYRMRDYWWPLCGAKQCDQNDHGSDHHILRSAQLEKTLALTTGCGAQVTAA
jgi:hypothetical protein